jgi:hypothetical protein
MIQMSSMAKGIDFDKKELQELGPVRSNPMILHISRYIHCAQKVTWR